MKGLKTLITIRKNLLYCRKRVRKLSLDELAVDMGVSKDTLFKLENNEIGKPMFPNLKTLINISDFFNIDLSEFISRDLEMDDLGRLGDMGMETFNLEMGALAK